MVQPIDQSNGRAVAHAGNERDSEDRDAGILAPFHRDPANWRGPIAGGVIALLVLWLLGLASCTPSMERDLTERSVAALDAAGMKGIDVDFDGRDATLSGAATASQARDAHTIVRALTGVRHVNEEFKIVADNGSGNNSGNGDGQGNGASDQTSAITANVGGRTITLTGRVATEEMRAAIEQRARDNARKSGGKFTIVNNLTVGEDGAKVDPSTDAVLAVLSSPDLNDLSGSKYTINVDADGALVLTGEVGTEADRAAVVAAVEAATSHKVIDRLRVTSSNTSSTVAPTTTAPAVTTTTLAPKAAAAQRDINALLALKVIEFASGSAALTPQGQAVLDEVAPLLIEAGTAKVQIVGHTDNAGNADQNVVLSQARAETVRVALVAKGIAADRLTTVGYGGTRPIADNNTSDGRQRNRRIEFVLSS